MNTWSRLKQIEPATAAPVSLAELKTQLGVTGDSQDAQLQSLLDTAVALIEGPYGIGVCLTPQTWQLSLDGFTRQIEIPLGPVTEIVSITYRDESGTNQTVTEWLVDVDAEPARIRASRGESWPAALCEPGSVKIQFVAGFEETPAPLKHAVLLTCKSLRRVGDNSALLRREVVEGVGTFDYAAADVATQVFDQTIERLIGPYRVGLFQ